jgi:hypothetical protein
MQTQKTNKNHAAESKAASVANHQFLQVEPAEVSELDLLAVSGGLPETIDTVRCGCTLAHGIC